MRETFLSPNDVEKKDIQGSDLLSLLLKANMASDLPESSRMSDKDIVCLSSPVGGWMVQSTEV